MKDKYIVWSNYNKLDLNNIPKELINKLFNGRKNMDDIKKIDPFQQMNADFDGVSINKWIELYTVYSCPKDTVFSLQKYYINNDNTLQLFVTDPNVFNDILYTKDNVLYANKRKMQLTSTFYMARHIDKQFYATSIYIASNFIKYVNEKNLGVIGNDKGDYLLYTRHDENVPYILQHNAGKFTFVKLQDMLTINDNKKSNSSTDTLQSDNMMSTQNKNTDNDIPTPNLKEIFSHVVPGNVNSIALHDIAKQVDKYTESLPKDTVVPQAFKMDEKGKFVHTGCYEKQNNVLSEESYINKPILGPSINIGPSINNYCLANSFQHTVDKYGIYVISSINHPSISNYEKELLQILSPENCDIINPLTYLNHKGTLTDMQKEIFGINLPAFYNDVVADTYPNMSTVFNKSLGASQKEIDTLDKRISEPTFTVPFKEKTIIGRLKLMLYYANIASEFKEINLNKNIHKSLAPNYERWDARDYNLAAIENNAERISAEENYITGTLQETEYQPDKQEVTINNLFKGM